MQNIFDNFMATSENNSFFQTKLVARHCGRILTGDCSRLFTLREEKKKGQFLLGL